MHPTKASVSLLLLWQRHLHCRLPYLRPRLLTLTLALTLTLETLLLYQLLVLCLLAALTFPFFAVLLSLADLCLAMLFPR